jgi:hypothetical protein
VGRAFVDADGELPEMRIGEWHLGRPLDNSLAGRHGNPVMQHLNPAFYEGAATRDPALPHSTSPRETTRQGRRTPA